MNIQNPPPAGNGAPPRGRKPRRTPKGRQIDPQAAADEVAALLGDRSRQRDLLIEHLHLIQDTYGHISAAHLAALAAEMKLSHDRGLRGRDLLRAFRRGEGRRDAAAAGHRARLRLAVLRDGRRRQAARRTAGQARARTCASCARRAWAPAIARRSAPSATCRCFNATPTSVAKAAAVPRASARLEGPHRLRALSRRRRLSRARRTASPASARATT